MSEVIPMPAAYRSELRPGWNRRWFPYVARGFVPVAAAVIALLLHTGLTNGQHCQPTTTYAWTLGIGLALYLVLLVGALGSRKIRNALLEKAPLIAALVVAVELWDLITLKFAWLPLPYFPGPEAVVSVLIEDWQLLGISTLYSLRLLVIGYAIGTTIGLTSGILIGWSHKARYWLMPLLKVIGPIPATAWIPLALILFPTSFWASIFLIALAVWFPVTMMTSSGIANVRISHVEVARTLGANTRYLVWRVAIPSAMPSIFIGLFMGLGASFLTLIVAEMLGVKAGLGWYVDWAKGWAEFNKVYAALLIIAVFFSSIITLLFKVRDWILVWQRGVIKW